MNRALKILLTGSLLFSSCGCYRWLDIDPNLLFTRGRPNRKLRITEKNGNVTVILPKRFHHPDIYGISLSNEERVFDVGDIRKVEIRARNTKAILLPIVIVGTAALICLVIVLRSLFSWA